MSAEGEESHCSLSGLKGREAISCTCPVDVSTYMCIRAALLYIVRDEYFLLAHTEAVFTLSLQDDTVGKEVCHQA